MICLTSKKGIDMIENMDLLSIITQKYLNVKNFSQDRLIDYLIFVYENAKQESQKGSENHHIAPEGDFPEYLNFKLFPDNKIILKGSDHYLAHYLLYKAAPTKVNVFAFNMMKRTVDKKDRVQFELAAALYEEAREDISKNISIAIKGRKQNLTEEQRKARREKQRGKVTVYDVNDLSRKTFEISVYNEKYLSGVYVYYRTGTTHTEETKLKIKENGLIDKNAYNNGIKVIYLKKNEEIPTGFVLGQLEKHGIICSERMEGLNYYYDPISKEHKRYYDGEQPENWIKGKLNFGIDGNPRNGKKVSYNFITKETDLIPTEDDYSKYCGNHQTKVAYLYKNYVTFNKSTISKLIPEIDSHLLQIMTKRLLKETESKIKINYIHEKYRNYLKQFNTYQEIGIKCMLIEDFLNIENKEFYQWV